MNDYGVYTYPTYCEADKLYMCNYSPITQYYNVYLKFSKKLFLIGAGTSDSVMMFREGDTVLIFTYNEALGYAGLNVLDWENDEVCDGIFWQNASEEYHEMFVFEEDQRRDFWDYSWLNQAKILYNYLEL